MNYRTLKLAILAAVTVLAVTVRAQWDANPNYPLVLLPQPPWKTNIGVFLDAASGQRISVPVNNIKDFGATGTSNWVADTAALRSAIMAQHATNGYPVYIPGGTYGISNIILSGSVFNTYDGAMSVKGIRIIGEWGQTKLYPATVSTPILTLTNGMNYVVLENLNFTGLGKNVSAPPLLVIDGPSGSTDGFRAEGCFFQGAWTAFDARAFSASHFQSCVITENRRAGVLMGKSGEANNNLYYQGGAVVANHEGFIASETQIHFNHIEGGAGTSSSSGQTNLVLVTNGVAQVHLVGCNIENWFGAIVTCSNDSGVNFSTTGSRLVNGGGLKTWLVDFQNTGLTNGSRVEIGAAGAVGVNVRIGGAYTGQTPNIVDHSPIGSLFVERPGVYTNHIGSFRVGESGFGDTAPALANNFNRIYSIRDSVGYLGLTGFSQHLLGIRSNTTPINIDLAQYYREKSVAQAFTFSAIGSPHADRTVPANTPYEERLNMVGLRRWRAPFVYPQALVSGIANYIPYAWAWMADEGGLGYGGIAFQVATNGSAYAARDVVAGYGGSGASGGLAMPTNYFSANFAPVSGQVRLVSSNDWLFAVTTARTNPIIKTHP